MPFPYDLTITLSIRASESPDDQAVFVMASYLAQKTKAKENRKLGCLYDFLVMDDNSLNPPSMLSLKQYRSTDIMPDLSKLTKSSRLYIVGHGDWRHHTVAGLGPRQLAIWLKAQGLTTVRTIGLVCCGLAADQSAANYVRRSSSIDSFASRFTQALDADVGVITARYFNTVVKPSGEKKQVTPSGEDIVGRFKARFFKSGSMVVRMTDGGVDSVEHED